MFNYGDIFQFFLMITFFNVGYSDVQWSIDFFFTDAKNCVPKWQKGTLKKKNYCQMGLGGPENLGKAKGLYEM